MAGTRIPEGGVGGTGETISSMCIIYYIPSATLLPPE